MAYIGGALSPLPVMIDMRDIFAGTTVTTVARTTGNKHGFIFSSLGAAALRGVAKWIGKPSLIYLCASNSSILDAMSKR